MRLLSGITAATLAKLPQSLTKADIENLFTEPTNGKSRSL
jgi:hypothetical protein